MNVQTAFQTAFVLAATPASPVTASGGYEPPNNGGPAQAQGAGTRSGGKDTTAAKEFDPPDRGAPGRTADAGSR